MNNLKVLMTGDYWHADFRSVIANAAFPITMQTLSSTIDVENDDRDFDLVVVAQSRRGQFEIPTIEKLLAKYVNTPVVSLCGSWCEGETRSGSPIAGLVRIYWHQWLGQIDNFVAQINEQQIATWQLPKIATIPDRVQHQTKPDIPIVDRSVRVGVSTFTQENFLTIQDALQVSGYQSQWIEGIDANDINDSDFSAICVDGNSLTVAFQNRIELLQNYFPHTPIILILNFPRSSEFAMAREMGISEIVSKPFQLCDLKFAVQRMLPSRAA